jgi:hypothetical protein
VCEKINGREREREREQVKFNSSQSLPVGTDNSSSYLLTSYLLLPLLELKTHSAKDG